MTKKAFDKIAAGLKEALAVAAGETKPAHMDLKRDAQLKELRKKIRRKTWGKNVSD